MMTEKITAQHYIDLDVYYETEVAIFTGESTTTPLCLKLFTEEEQIERYSRHIGFWLIEQEKHGCGNLVDMMDKGGTFIARRVFISNDLCELTTRTFKIFSAKTAGEIMAKARRILHNKLSFLLN